MTKLIETISSCLSRTYICSLLSQIPHKPGSRELITTLYKSCLVVLRVDHLTYAFFRSVNTGIMHDTGITKSGVTNDNIYIDMQAGRNLLPKLPVADN